MKTKVVFYLICLLTTVVITVANTSADKKLQQANNEYKVVTVQGRIIYEETGKDMMRGDNYITGTALNFTTSTARAAVVNDINGRFVLSSSKGKVKVLPAANNVSSRSGAILNIVDLKNHFIDRYFIVGIAKVQIDKESFPMDADHFFYMKYEHNGEIINKKLSFENDVLFLDRAEIFKIDGNPIEVSEKEMTLYYKSDKAIKINAFTPVFANETELKEEIKIILKASENKNNAEKINEITSYVNEFYGKPNKENFLPWLKEEFDIE